jgi:hypothetical protein
MTTTTSMRTGGWQSRGRLGVVMLAFGVGGLLGLAGTVGGLLGLAGTVLVTSHDKATPESATKAAAPGHVRAHSVYRITVSADAAEHRATSVQHLNVNLPLAADAAERWVSAGTRLETTACTSNPISADAADRCLAGH